MRSFIRRYVASWLLLFAIGTLLPAQALAQDKIPVRIGIQPNILPELVLKEQGILEKKYGARFNF